MIRVSILSVILLFSAVQLQASLKDDSKQAAVKPTLRALRAQMAANKPTTLAAVVGTIAAIGKAAEEQPKISVFSKSELEKMTVEVSDEEAAFHKLSKPSAASLLGKTIVGSIAQGGKSQPDLEKIMSLGYSPKEAYERGTFVIVYAQDRCYYGLVINKNADDSYQVQVGDAATVKVGAGDIASHTK